MPRHPAQRQRLIPRRPVPRRSSAGQQLDGDGRRRDESATKIITVSLPEELLQRLDQAARSAYLSRSAFLRDLTRRYLAARKAGP